MEYVQMTINDWLNIKEQLRKDLYEAQATFVRIGYALRKIEDEKLYLQDGYASVAEFAKAEYGLDKTAVSRFISINRKYSVDGYSDRLIPEYARYGQSKLSEMLSLPDNDMEMLQPTVTRESIRELKQFNKIVPEPAAVDDLGRVIEEFFKENQELLNELCSSVDFVENNVDKLTEMVNPSGNRSYRKGIFYLMMYDNDIRIKQFGHDPRVMTWKEFFDIVHLLFDADLGPDTWNNHFGEVNKMVEESEEHHIAEAGEMVEESTKPEEKQEEEQLPGQMEVADYPEMLPEVKESVIKPAESVIKPTESVTEPAENVIEQEDNSEKPDLPLPSQDEMPEERPAAEEMVEPMAEIPAPIAPETPVAPAQQFLENQEETPILEEENEPENSAVIVTRWEVMKGLNIEQAAAELSLALDEARRRGRMPSRVFWLEWLEEEMEG